MQRRHTALESIRIFLKSCLFAKEQLVILPLTRCWLFLNDVWGIFSGRPEQKTQKGIFITLKEKVKSLVFRKTNDKENMYIF